MNHDDDDAATPDTATADTATPDTATADTATADTATADSIDFYWRPGCGFCSRLHRKLENEGVSLTLHNIWEDPEAAAVVRAAANGNETVPTIGVAGAFLVNPRPAAVIELASQRAPGALAGRDRAL